MLFRIVNETVRENCIREIRALPLNGFEINISEIKRTDAQNKYYWSVIGIIAKELGYRMREIDESSQFDKDDFHEAAKRQFIGVEDGIDNFGNLYIRPKSSKNLKKSEFSHFLEKVLIYAAQENIRIPSMSYYGLEERNVKSRKVIDDQAPESPSNAT